MSKIKVVYWSSTGNTEAMAEAIARGIESAGGEAQLLEADNVSASDFSDDQVFALGCPAMGAEELEDSVVEPLVADLEGSVSGRRSRCSVPMTGATANGCVSGQREWRKQEHRLWEARA